MKQVAEVRTRWKKVKMVAQKDVITDQKGFPLLVLLENFILELEQQNKLNNNFHHS